MNKCHVCNSIEFKKEFVQEVFEIEGKHFLVKDIPANVCLRCGEKIFSRVTTENIRRLLHGEGTPQKSVSLDVFEYHAV